MTETAKPSPTDGDDGVSFDELAALALDEAQPASRRLLALMACLRDKARGCPWDIEQDFGSIAPYTLEEAYEVVAAIEAGDRAALQSELGDLLLQVVYHAQMGAEEGSFDFEAVARDVTDNMVARHPHVFGDDEVRDAAAMRQKWEALKAQERAVQAQSEGRAPSRLDNLPLALPALTRAYKLQNRAARMGFDWPDHRGAQAKLDEEVGELNRALAQLDGNGDAASRAAVADEMGDVLFATTNLARKLGLDPEGVLRGANRKFERRFRGMEAKLADSETAPESCSLAYLERLWQQAKADEVRDSDGPAD